MRIAIAGATGVVGRHVVTAAEARGHEVVPLTRAGGHDLRAGKSVAAAFDGVEAVIDVTSVGTTSAARSRAFFEAVTRTLLDGESAAGVGHHVALSIVGIDRIDDGYYAGKLAQERAVERGDVPWTVLRATQFHEFAEQTLPRGRLVGSLHLVPSAPVRTVAAREVGSALVDAAEAGPSGRIADFRGPETSRLIDLVRRMLAHDGARRTTLEAPLPGRFFAGMRSGALLGTEAAKSGAITFDAWLDSPDHTPVEG